MSPKGRWIAYTTRGETNNASLSLYDLETRQSYPVSRGFADIGSPVFSKDGKLLFFSASTNAGSFYAGLDMTTQDRPYRAGLYAAVLEADGKSPKAEEGDKPKKGVTVDAAGLEQQIVSLPMAEAFYTSLATAKDGSLFAVENEQPGVAVGPGSGPARARLMRFDFKERKADKVADGIVSVSTDADGDKLLLATHDGNLVTSAAGKKLQPKPVN